MRFLRVFIFEKLLKIKSGSPDSNNFQRFVATLVNRQSLTEIIIFSKAVICVPMPNSFISYWANSKSPIVFSDLTDFGLAAISIAILLKNYSSPKRSTRILKIGTRRCWGIASRKISRIDLTSCDSESCWKINAGTIILTVF